jgi:membrane protein DedA with SNARE-associated domain
MTGLIREFGVLGVFLLMVPESACIPIPSEITLLFSGFAVHQGWIDLPLAVASATAGNLVGSLLAYGVGASGVLAGVPGAGQIIDRWQRPIERHGDLAILYARLLPLARTFVALPAGARRTRLGPFVGYTVIGSAVWALAFILIGLAVGAGWQTLDSVLGRGLLVVGLLTAALVTHRSRGRR